MRHLDRRSFVAYRRRPGVMYGHPHNLHAHLSTDAGRSPIIPKYYQVEMELRERIAELEAGSALPSEPELAKEYGVSRATVRVAITELESLGFLQRVQGRGTFVRKTGREIPLGYHDRDDQEPQSDEIIPHKVVQTRTTAAGPTWAGMFRISPAEPVYCVDRISLEGGVPMSYDRLVVPRAAVPSLVEADLTSGRFFYILIDQGLPITRYRVSIEPVSIGGEIAETLQVRPGLPGLGVTRHGLDGGGRVLAHVRIVTRGDVGRYVLEFDAPVAAHRRTNAVADHEDGH